MQRRVIWESDVHTKAPEEKKATKAHEEKKADDYLNKLWKYIPAEIVAAFLAIQGIVTAAQENSTESHTEWIQWIVFSVLFVLTPLYMYRVTKEPGKPTTHSQVIIATIAFAVWVFALGGPFVEYSWYETYYGAIAVTLYTVAAPVFVNTSVADTGNQSGQG